jgi:hypothetical protein
MCLKQSYNAESMLCTFICKVIEIDLFLLFTEKKVCRDVMIYLLFNALMRGLLGF